MGLWTQLLGHTVDITIWSSCAWRPTSAISARKYRRVNNLFLLVLWCPSAFFKGLAAARSTWHATVTCILWTFRAANQEWKSSLGYKTLNVAKNENVMFFSVTPCSLVCTKYNLVRSDDSMWTATADTNQPEEISAGLQREHAVPVPPHTHTHTHTHAHCPGMNPGPSDIHPWGTAQPTKLRTVAHITGNSPTHISKYNFCKALTFLFILYCRYSQNRHHHLSAVFASFLYFNKYSWHRRKCCK